MGKVTGQRKHNRLHHMIFGCCRRAKTKWGFFSIDPHIIQSFMHAMAGAFFIDRPGRVTLPAHITYASKAKHQITLADVWCPATANNIHFGGQTWSRSISFFGGQTWITSISCVMCRPTVPLTVASIDLLRLSSLDALTFVYAVMLGGPPPAGFGLGRKNVVIYACCQVLMTDLWCQLPIGLNSWCMWLDSR